MGTAHRWAFRSVATAALAALASCVTPSIEASSARVEAGFPFLRAGETRKAEVMERLGAPAFRHDVDRTLIWVATEDEDGRVVVLDQSVHPAGAPGPIRIAWELVLEFDASDVYVRGSLVHAR